MYTIVKEGTVQNKVMHTRQNRNICNCKIWEIIKSVTPVHGDFSEWQQMFPSWKKYTEFTYYVNHLIRVVMWNKSGKVHDLNADFKLFRLIKAAVANSYFTHSVALVVLFFQLFIFEHIPSYSFNYIITKYIYYILSKFFLFLLFNRLFDITPIFSSLGCSEHFKGFWLTSSKYTPTGGHIYWEQPLEAR